MNNDRNVIIRKSATNFIKTFGPLNKRKATDLMKGLQDGSTKLQEGISAQEGAEILLIAAGMSQAYLGTNYTKENWTKNPAAGVDMMKSELMQSPETLRQVAERTKSPAFTEKIQTMGLIPAPREAADTSESFTQQVGSGNDSFDNRAGYATVPDGSKDFDHTISPTPGGGGYQRVSNMNGFRDTPTPKQGGNVTMAADGRGGTYRGSLGSGDSRQVSGHSDS